MITYWQQLEGNFSKVKKNTIDETLPLWIDARNVTRDETTLLQEEYQIEQDHILDILDPDELSRIEEGDGDYILTIVRVPVYDPQAETPYFTVPVGIIIKGKTIITICWTDCELLRDFGINRVRNVRLNDFPSFIVHILNRANLNFLRYLKEINRRSTSIQNEMRTEIENHEILQLLGLEKSLVYFATSLKSNSLLLQKMKTTRLIKFDEEDIDFVEGVAIDNRQAIEMADTYSNILFGVMDAFSSGESLEYLFALLRSSEEDKRITSALRKELSPEVWPESSKKAAVIASRYLNSVGKGENALELSSILQENYSKKGTPEFQEFHVPEYIKNAIEWVCDDK